MFKTASKQEAIDWIRRCPNPLMDDAEIEIRQVFELEDFGDAATPELRAKEQELRARLDSRS